MRISDVVCGHFKTHGRRYATRNGFRLGWKNVVWLSPIVILFGVSFLNVFVSVYKAALEVHPDDTTPDDMQQRSTRQACSNADNLTLLADINRNPKQQRPLRKSPSSKGIPLVLYQTAKDQCLSTSMYNNTIRRWLEDPFTSSQTTLSYRFYDDRRMDADLYKNHEGTNKRGSTSAVFPALPLALQCIEHVNLPVMKADLWRYLILWENGGIFADLDVLPHPSLMKYLEQTEGGDDDALFVLVDTAGKQVLSQWFMAVTPHHPIMYYAVEEAAFQVLQAKRALPIQHTGPRALYDATDRFLLMKHQGNCSTSPSEGTTVLSSPEVEASSWRHLKAGSVYYECSGYGGWVEDHTTRSINQLRRSFHVLPSSWAQNNAFESEKKKAYELMNMTHYRDHKQQKMPVGGGSRSSLSMPYNGKTCLEFLGGSAVEPSSQNSGAITSFGASFIYKNNTYSFHNPMPHWM